MSYNLQKLEEKDLSQFKKDMQEAFQLGFEDVYGKTDDEILPEKHINEALSGEGAVAFKVVEDGEIIGGAIVTVKGSKGNLEFIYSKRGIQGKGIGQAIWQYIEKQFPEVTVWETFTPYFDRRNLHFYINCCGFSAVEFYNKKHPDPSDPRDASQLDESDDFFRFEKKM